MLIVKSSTIIIIPEEYSLFPIKILDLLKKYKVNFIFWVPTILVNIANMDLLKNIKLSNLKKIWFAGEVFPTRQFNYWFAKLPKTKFVNLYGPIEITLDCTYFVVDRKFNNNEPLPIGFKFKNTDILILNKKNQICKINEVGELCVRGSSVAMGYYKNLLKTKSVFVQNPLNNSYPELIYKTGDLVLKNFKNEILFKGRKDDLIKHRGYRIELKEIEHIIINNLKLVSNACVVYDHLNKNIILFYESQKIICEKLIKKKFYKFIPQYMIPKEYKKVSIMKKNINGKIDRLYYDELVNKKNY
jgi:acyl-coenzyme A synthetase/AMP-(fatty) acid ligase